MARRVRESCPVVPKSFVDDVTWVAVGKSATEVQHRLERAAAAAIRRARDNGAAFEVAKTEAILFSRSRKHWKERANSGARVRDFEYCGIERQQGGCASGWTPGESLLC